MQLSKIYANKDFGNVSFKNGLNVIIGKISNREDRELDTHNIGKSLLLEVIDFLLLKGIDDKSKYFLTRHKIFFDYVFFAELKLNSGQFLLVRRATQNNTKISFKLLNTKLDGFIVDIDEWDYVDLPIKEAKEKLNEYVGFDVLTNWPYRKTINYFMRHQNDYVDVFKLGKFQGVHKDWKPMVFELLGFDGSLLHKRLDLNEQFEEKKKELQTLERENGVGSEDEDKIIGLIDIQKQTLDNLAKNIDDFNFFEKDNIEKDKLVSELDARISDYNARHYYLKYEIEKIEKSLSADIDYIDLDALRAIYDEVQINFPDTILNEYQKVLEFNKQIGQERNRYLKENFETYKIELDNLLIELYKIEQEKSLILMEITNKSSYEKFKTYQKQLAKTEAYILNLENKLEQIGNMSRIQKELSEIEEQIKLKVAELKKVIYAQNHRHIRKLFNDFTIKVLNAPSILSVKTNKANSIDFEADYQNKEDLSITDLSKGFTYKKILCAAFDVALLQHYNDKSFYRFVYHDGILDSLDIRKKETYIQHIRNVVSEYNIQYILTIIESETSGIGQVFNFTDDEIRLRLSDESCETKLFRQCF